jgi:hypothetical protein
VLGTFEGIYPNSPYSPFAITCRGVTFIHPGLVACQGLHRMPGSRLAALAPFTSASVCYLPCLGLTWLASQIAY